MFVEVSPVITNQFTVTCQNASQQLVSVGDIVGIVRKLRLQAKY